MVTPASRKQPGDARALNAIGRLLYKIGRAERQRKLRLPRQRASIPATSRAISISRIRLSSRSRFDDARRHYERVLELDPEHPMAHQGLAYVLDELGEIGRCRTSPHLGFPRSLSEGSYRGDGEPVRVLLLCSALGGTVSTAQFLDERSFSRRRSSSSSLATNICCRRITLSSTRLAMRIVVRKLSFAPKRFLRGRTDRS